MIILSNEKRFSEDDLADLFHSVGWEKDTSPSILFKAMQNSSHIVSAWDGKKLVGIIRSMDDFVWSANIDCLVVHKEYQNMGIGTSLVEELLKQIKHILCISVSPNEKENIGFYLRFGFKIIEDSRLLQLYRD